VLFGIRHNGLFAALIRLDYQMCYWNLIRFNCLELVATLFQHQRMLVEREKFLRAYFFPIIIVGFP
jgi:hypothetical protein